LLVAENGRLIKSRRMRWTGQVASIGAMRNIWIILVGKLEVKRPFRRARPKWEDNIRMDLREVGWEAVDWIYVAQDRDQVAGCCERGNEPSGSTKGGEFLD
jgi:hypothetical protein